jgi:hypothetical protein
MTKPQTLQTLLLRPGDPAAGAPDTEWLRYTPAERIEAVWTLTLACMAGGEASREPDESRLQKTVVRVLRPPDSTGDP